MYDPVARGLSLLDAEASRKGIVVQPDPDDPRRRSYLVDTGNGRKQLVWAAPVPDPMFRERLDLVSISVRAFQADQPLLHGLLGSARDLRRARLCIFNHDRPAEDQHLGVASSFLPEELNENCGIRLLHALREVAAVADAIEAQLLGVDLS